MTIDVSKDIDVPHCGSRIVVGHRVERLTIILNITKISSGIQPSNH